MITPLIVIRHGETLSNLHDRVSGYDDDPLLTGTGEEQAAEAAEILHGSVRLAVSALTQRCVATGEIAFGLEIPPEHCFASLNERRYGKFDGGPNSAWKAFMAGQESELKRLSVYDRRRFNFGEGIENEQDVIERAVGAVAMIAGLAEGTPTGVATSGGIIRALVQQYKGIDLPMGRVDNLARLHIDHDNRDGTVHIVSMSGVRLDD